MATNKLLHFKTQNRFNEAVLNDEIPEDSIAFIQEGTEVYTHSTLYAHYDEYKDGDYNMNNCLNPGIYYGCTLGRPIGSAEDEYYALRVSNLGKKIEDTEIPIRPANYNWKFNHDLVIEGYCNYDFNEERFSLFYGIVDPQTSRPTEYNELYYSQVLQNSQANSTLLFYMDCDLPKPGEYYISFEIAALNTRLQNEQGIPPVVSDSYVDVYIVYYEDGQLVRIPYKVYTKERYADDRGTMASYEDITTIYERIACSTNKIRVEVHLRGRSNANWFLFRKKVLTLIEPEMDIVEQICTSKVLDHQYRRILYTTDRSQYESPFTLYEEWHSMTEHLDRALMRCELSTYNTNWYLNFYDKAGVESGHVYMPSATTTIAGLMSGLDKQHLDTAYEVLGTSESAQGVIDKFNEVKEFLEGITVDETLIDLLNGLTPIAYIGNKANNNGAQKTDLTYLNVVTDYAKRSLVLGDGNEILVHDVTKPAYYPWNVVIEGANNKSDAMQSHVEGKLNSAVWDVNGAMRRANYEESLITKYNLTDDPDYGADCAHVEGHRNVASGWISHAEGNKNVAAGRNSHAEGHGTLAAGSTSHAEGRNTIARGSYSHAQGNATEANGASSFAAGKGTIATTEAETALGRYNVPGHLFSIGIGTDDNNRKNAIEIEADGSIGFYYPENDGYIYFSDMVSYMLTDVAFTQSNGSLVCQLGKGDNTTVNKTVPIATTIADGAMSKEDKTLLDNVVEVLPKTFLGLSGSVSYTYSSLGGGVQAFDITILEDCDAILIKGVGGYGNAPNVATINLNGTSIKSTCAYSTAFGTKTVITSVLSNYSETITGFQEKAYNYLEGTSLALHTLIYNVQLHKNDKLYVEYVWSSGHSTTTGVFGGSLLGLIKTPSVVLLSSKLDKFSVESPLIISNNVLRINNSYSPTFKVTNNPTTLAGTGAIPNPYLYMTVPGFSTSVLQSNVAQFNSTDLSITGTKLSSGPVTVGFSITDGAVTTAKLASQAVDDTKIANGAVTKDKLDSDVADNNTIELDPNNGLKLIYRAITDEYLDEALLYSIFPQNMANFTSWNNRFDNSLLNNLNLKYVFDDEDYHIDIKISKVGGSAYLVMDFCQDTSALSNIQGFNDFIIAGTYLGIPLDETTSGPTAEVLQTMVYEAPAEMSWGAFLSEVLNRIQNAAS